jgi:hypothetical protein
MRVRGKSEEVLRTLSDRKKGGRISHRVIEDMLAAANILEVLEREYDLYFDEGSKGWWNTNCPLPGHDDSSPSFGIHPESGMYHCFGCIASNEPIVTKDGIIPLSEIKPGNFVLGKNGDWDRVLFVINKGVRNCIKFETSVFRSDGLVLTEDHRCLVVKLDDVSRWLPYMVKHPARGLKYLSSARAKKRSKRYQGKLKLTEVLARDVSLGDYMAYPVISEYLRKNEPVKTTVPYGKNGATIEFCLPCHEDIAWLYGLYLAEGSIGRGYVCFSLHRNEAETHGRKAIELIKKHFNVEGAISFPRSRPNSCEVHFCSTALALALATAFGSGAQNKKLPPECMIWPANVQKQLLQGHRDGDGRRRDGVVSTISHDLAHGIFHIAIQAGEHPSIVKYPSSTDGVCHSEFWTINTLRPSVRAFFEDIEGTQYYLTRLDRICDSGSTSVFDITTESTNSFLTKLGIVHNCGEKGTLLTFIQKVEGLSFPEAVARLSLITGIGIDEEQGELHRTVRDIKDAIDDYLSRSADTNLPGGMSEPAFLRAVAARVREFEAKSEHHPEAIRFADELYQEMDHMVYEQNHKGLTSFWAGLGKRMRAKLTSLRAESAEVTADA